MRVAACARCGRPAHDVNGVYPGTVVQCTCGERGELLPDGSLGPVTEAIPAEMAALLDRAVAAAAAARKAHMEGLRCPACARPARLTEGDQRRLHGRLLVCVGCGKPLVLTPELELVLVPDDHPDLTDQHRQEMARVPAQFALGLRKGGSA